MVKDVAMAVVAVVVDLIVMQATTNLLATMDSQEGTGLLKKGMQGKPPKGVDMVVLEVHSEGVGVVASVMENLEKGNALAGYMSGAVEQDEG